MFALIHLYSKLILTLKAIYELKNEKKQSTNNQKKSNY
jgi:hypothetical protein